MIKVLVWVNLVLIALVLVLIGTRLNVAMEGLEKGGIEFVGKKTLRMSGGLENTVGLYHWSGAIQVLKGMSALDVQETILHERAHRAHHALHLAVGRADFTEVPMAFLESVAKTAAKMNGSRGLEYPELEINLTARLVAIPVAILVWFSMP